MIKAKPLSLAQKLKNIVDICEQARTAIDGQLEIIKGALDAGKENDGIEPAVVRKILARRKKLAKDPAETTRLEDLMTDYQFMLGEGRQDTRPWTQTDDEISRVMALTNTSRPPKIEAIKKALGCSQGKAHKLRSIVAVRLAKKSSSSPHEREHEHLPESEDAAPLATLQPDSPPMDASDRAPIKPEPDGGVGSGDHSETAELDTRPGSDGGTAENEAASASVAAEESCGERAEPLGASGPALSCTLTTPPSGPQDHSDDSAPQAPAASPPTTGEPTKLSVKPVPDGGVGAGTHSDEETTAAMEAARLRLAELKQARGFA